GGQNQVLGVHGGRARPRDPVRLRPGKDAAELPGGVSQARVPSGGVGVPLTLRLAEPGPPLGGAPRHGLEDALGVVDFRRGFVTHFRSRNWPRNGPVKSTPARCRLPLCGEVFWANDPPGHGLGALGDGARLGVESQGDTPEAEVAERWSKRSGLTLAWPGSARPWGVTLALRFLRGRAPFPRWLSG